jgi:hypothetical protein
MTSATRLLKSTACMEREGALTKVLLPKCSGMAALAALGLGDDHARARGRRHSASGLGTAALGLGLGDSGAVDQPSGATLCQLGRELARVPAV